MTDPKEVQLFDDMVMSQPCVRRVVDNNRGARTVVKHLMHRTRWAEMMHWLANNDYCGAMLWVLYKDVFHEDHFALGDFILYMMGSKHYSDRVGYSEITWLDVGKYEGPDVPLPDF